MKTILDCINEAKSQKLKDVYSEVKKLCGKAKFFWEPSDWSVAFKWKDDDYIVVKRPRGLRSKQYNIKDYNGNIEEAVDDILDIFNNKEHFIKVNCRTVFDEDVNKLNIKDYTICRVRPEKIYAVCPIMKNGKASVYGNESEKWTLDKFDLDEETFENYKQMRQKANEKLIKEQGKRFDKKDNAFSISLVIPVKNTGVVRFMIFTFDKISDHFNKYTISPSDKEAIINKIKELQIK